MKWFERYAERHGVKVNPDLGVVDSIEQYHLANKRQCPCIPKYAQDKDTVCPCKSFRESLKTGGCNCPCGLFVES